MAAPIPMTPALRDKCKQAVRQLASHNYAPPFMQPVDPVALGIPDYFDIIKQPMDLGTVNKRINDPKTSHYKTFEDFCTDVKLVFTNCLTYNNTAADELIRTMAITLSKIFDKFVADVQANPAKFGVGQDKGRGARAKPAAKRPRPEDAADPKENAGEGEEEGEEGAETGKRRRRGDEYTPMSVKLPVGTPEQQFWVGVELSWDDLGIGGGTRRIPVMGRAIIDLYQLYNLSIKYGGYDVINGMKGGWTSLYRELMNVTTVEGSAASRLKKMYERMLLEYERRIAAGWTLESPRPYAVLTQKEVFYDAGRGIPQSVADAKSEAIDLLSSKTGTAALIIPDPVPGEVDTSRVKSATETKAAANAAPVVKELRKPKLVFCTHSNSVFGTAPVLSNGFNATQIIPFSVDLPNVAYVALSPLVAANLSTRLDNFSEQVRAWFAAAKSGKLSNNASKEGDVLSVTSMLTAKAAKVAECGDASAESIERVTGLAAEYTDFEAWIRGRTTRVLQPLMTTTTEDEEGAAGKARSHDKFCTTCNTARRVRKPAPAEGAEATSPSASGNDDGSGDGDAKRLESDQRAVETESEFEDELEGQTEGDGALARRGRKAAPLRAWALCGSCSVAQCFECVFPTPESCKCATEEAREEFLTTSGKQSAESGACSREGAKSGLSDIPVWFCKRCRMQRTPTWAGIPWCAHCAASLGGPPAVTESDNLARIPSTDVDYDWPKYARCMVCKLGYHAHCADVSGMAVFKKEPPTAESPADVRLDTDEYACYSCFTESKGNYEMLQKAAIRVPAVALWNAPTREIMVHEVYP